MHTYMRSVDVHMLLELSFHNFYQLFLLFRLSFFPGPISIIIDILWAQLVLEFFADRFETMHICST